MDVDTHGHLHLPLMTLSLTRFGLSGCFTSSVCASTRIRTQGQCAASICVVIFASKCPHKKHSDGECFPIYSDSPRWRGHGRIFERALLGSVQSAVDAWVKWWNV